MTSAPLPSLTEVAIVPAVIWVVSVIWSILAYRRDEEQHRRDIQVLADAIAARQREDETKRTRRS